MWEEALKKTTTKGFTTRPGLGVLVRAWGVFTFDRTKHTLVYSVLVSSPYPLLTFPVVQCCGVEKAIHSQSNTVAALEFLRTLQTRAPAQDQRNVTARLKERSTAVLPSV